MRDWFVLTHNPLNHQSITVRLQELGVKVYSPHKITLYKRKDRPSSLRREEQLFPGYLLLDFDPYDPQTHTSKITALNGAYGFVQFGAGPARVKAEIVEGLKKGMLRTDSTISGFDFHSLPSALEQALYLISDMRTEAARKSAFFALLKEYNTLERLAGRATARIYSTLHPI